ncbi:MAG: nicotinate-nucleotide adenylyltransferase [Thermosynechococcaceae cyanobacterium MS004]|nr:nicotinate-nucleotide adenylyltransferase [Thermosynechococcaceae cyanobacterium MS004]
MTHTALFGTSADPPTLGHQSIVEWLAPQFDQVAVWASDNPFKGQQTPFVHRQAMLALMIEEITRKFSQVQFAPQLAYPRTLHSVQRARSDFQDSVLVLVVGSDLVDTLPTWYQAKQLLQWVELLIVSRPGTPIETTNLAALKALGARFTLANFVGPDTSSTAYREGAEQVSVIPAIATYIQQNGLYSEKSR